MNARSCALTILNDFDTSHKSLDACIDVVFNSGKQDSFEHPDKRDKRLAFEIVMGVLRNRTYLDYIIAAYLTQPHFRQNEHLMQIMRIGVYQLLFLDKIPDHASVNECVKLAKSDARTRNVQTVVNAVLRKITQAKMKLPKPGPAEELTDRLSILYSHPQWLVTRWLASFGLPRTKKLLSFFNARPSIFVRRKLRGLTHQTFESLLGELYDKDCAASGYKNLYYRLGKSVLSDELQLLRQGCCTIQSESSGWVVALLDVRRGETVLDVCAAPGAKATLIQELVEETGRVYACDKELSRLELLQTTVRNLGLNDLYRVVCDGRELPFIGLFHKVLLDAPCSGTGVMHRHPDSRWLRTAEHITHAAQLQKELLDAVSKVVAPGGVLVYSTCSLEPEENQQQIAAFLERHPDFILDMPMNLVKPAFIDNQNYLFITPFEHKMDGMFAARLRKR